MAVVSVAHGAFGPLLGKLTSLLAEECGRLKGVRREIRSLRSELASMHAALKEYTKLEDPNDQVKVWISLVRELAYDTEDVFDKFIHHLGDSRDHGGFKEFFRKTVRRLKTLGARHGIAGEIHDLKDRIKQVKELKDCYKLNDSPSSTGGPASVDPRLQAIFADEAHLVGVDGPRDDLAKWMVEEGNNSSKPCKVLSIVGFGGLGKTTLANEVYRKIQGQFDCKAFVSVSQKPDIKKIMKDVISEVSCQDGSTKDTTDWDEKKCIAKLRQLLENKRYLIIIDDVWSTQAWHTIKCAFPESNCSSRIIATTRIIDVAKSCCPGRDDRVYELEALSDLHSRRLFFKRLLGSEEHCPDTLKDVSSKILKKCGGLPLGNYHLIGFLNKKLPNGIGGMRNLQLMPGFVITSQETDVLKDLGNLTCLEELQVFLSRYVSCEHKRCEKEAFLSSLCKLGTCKLRSLNIEYSSGLDFLDSWSPVPSSLQSFWATCTDSFMNFPKWITPALINLAGMYLFLTELTEDGLLTLGQLPSLLWLELIVSNKFVGTVQGVSFPSLKVLNLRDTERAYVSFVKGSAPKLDEITFMTFSVSAAKADGFYSGIEHLHRLKRAHIWLDGEDATPSECKAAAAAIRKEADANPNHPAVTFEKEPEEEDNKETGGSEEEKSKEDGNADED